MFGFGKKDDKNTQNSAQGQNPQNAGNMQNQGSIQNPILNQGQPNQFNPQGSAAMPIPGVSGTNIQPGSFDPNFSPQGGQPNTPPNQAGFNQTQPQNTNQPTPGFDPSQSDFTFASPATPAPNQSSVNSSGFDFNPTNTNPVSGGSDFNQQSAAGNSQTPPQNTAGDVDFILSELEQGKTFSIENYSFGYDSTKAAEGNAYWEQGPQGQVFGDKTGLQEFLNEQDGDTIAAIKKQLAGQQVPTQQPAAVNPTTNAASTTPADLNFSSNPSASFDAQENTSVPSFDSNNLENSMVSNNSDSTPVQADTQKLREFVDYVNRLEEVKKVIQEHLKGV
jgi:hypothetical protein